MRIALTHSALWSGDLVVWVTTLSPGPEQSLSVAVLRKCLLNEATFISFGLFSACCPQALSLLVLPFSCPIPWALGAVGFWLNRFQWVSASGRYWRLGGWEDGGGIFVPCSPPWSQLGPPQL